MDMELLQYEVRFHFLYVVVSVVPAVEETSTKLVCRPQHYGFTVTNILGGRINSKITLLSMEKLKTAKELHSASSLSTGCMPTLLVRD